MQNVTISMHRSKRSMLHQLVFSSNPDFDNFHVKKCKKHACLIFSGNPDFDNFHVKKRKKHVVLDSLSSFMGGYSTFFRQVVGHKQMY